MKVAPRAECSSAPGLEAAEERGGKGTEGADGELVTTWCEWQVCGPISQDHITAAKVVVTIDGDDDLRPAMHTRGAEREVNREVPDSEAIGGGRGSHLGNPLLHPAHHAPIVAKRECVAAV
eukprot:scaffold40992_cov33-Tisochrysis_lutea.AAC.3